jgi:predicted nucleotidyltransferase
MKTLEEIKTILRNHMEELRQKYKVKEIAIFGSYVRGEQKEVSDIDILVELYEVPGLLKFIELERYLENLLGVKVDLVRKNALRKEIKESVLKEALVV